jgi:predicted amidohydrolase
MNILSAIQFKPDFAKSKAEVKNNIRKCEKLVYQAGQYGSSLIVFPELCMTGYSFLSHDEAWPVAENLSDPANSPTFSSMKKIAIDLKSYVVWGFIESKGNTLCNSAALVGPDGNLITSYSKINLWGNDYLWATPGENAPDVVKTDIGNISIIVCRDIRDKIPDNIPRIAKSEPIFPEGQKIDIVAAPVNWGKSGFPSVSWMNFAANNNCTLVVANRWGEERNGDFKNDFGQGGSIIVEKTWVTHTDGLLFNQDCVVSTALP